MLKFDNHLFSKCVRMRRGSNSLRVAAVESGVSKATICRIEAKQHTPSIEQFGLICDWLKMEPGGFFNAAAKGGEA